MVAGQHDLNELCKEKFKQLDAHLKDSPHNRDMLVRHEGQICNIEKSIDRVIAWVIGSSGTILLTILLAALGLAVTWGRTLEKIDRLEKASNVVDVRR